MSCDRRCFENGWKYGEIDCSQCPGQDSNITIELREGLQIELDAKLLHLGVEQ